MAELDVSETVASVLVRRGLGDPDAARAFLQPESISHDPLVARGHGGGCRAAAHGRRAGRADLRPRRLRRRRHLRYGARDADVERARSRRRLAPPEPVRGRLRRLHDDDRAARGGRREASPHGRLRHHRLRRGRGCPPARCRRDRHRPPSPGGDAAAVPDRRHAALRLSLCGAVRDRCGRQARAGAPRRRPPDARPPCRSRRPRHDRRCRPARRREPCTRDDRPPGSRAHPETRAPRPDARGRCRPRHRRRNRSRVPAGPQDQRGRAPGAARRRTASRSHR